MVTSAILLAAGSGSRFGGGKLVAKLPDGTPIAVASWRNLSAAAAHCIAVVRSGDIALQKLLEAEGAAVIECEDAHDGMSRSLIAGLRATGDPDGWVIALGDMPYVRPDTIRRVREAIDAGALIAIPTHHGMRGHPVGLSARLRSELLKIQGDEGAREVIMGHAQDCILIECDDPGVLRDIDTREDIK